MLVVTSSVGMLNGIHSNTTNLNNKKGLSFTVHEMVVLLQNYGLNNRDRRRHYLDMHIFSFILHVIVSGVKYPSLMVRDEFGIH